MRLNVQKFRQWIDEGFEFPDTGLIRLAGDSGAGKSSMMYAIAWALYGQQATKNVTTLGHKGAEVVLHWNGLSVTRAKNPERLTANEAVDEAAQKRIESTMEMTWEQFAASSFIQQGMRESLLSLTPADQLRFVQRLAFGAEDPDTYRDRIYAEMKSLEESIGKHDAAIAALEGQRAAIQASLATLPAGASPFELKVTQADLTDKETALKAELAVDKKRYQDCSKRMEQLQAEKSHPDRRLGDVLITLRNEVVAREQELAEAHETPSAIPMTTEEQDDLRRKLDMCARQRMYLSNLATIERELSTLGVCGPLDTAKKELEVRLHAEKVSLDDLMYMSDNHKANIQKIKDSVDVLTCPACSAPLRRSPQGQLVHAHTTVSFDSAMLAEEQAALRKVTEDAKRVADKIKAIEVVLRADPGQPPLPKASTLEIVQQVTGKIEAKLSEHQKAVAANAARNAKICQCEKTVASAKVKLADAQKRFDATTLREESLINAELRSVEADRELVNSDIMSTEQALSSIVAQIRETQGKLADAQKEATLREQLQSCEASIALKTRERDAVQSQHTAAVRLKNLSDVAATECVASILDSINANAKYYLDLLFPDQGTSIRILNEKENKTDGKKKAQFSVSIVHRGLEYGALSELSGGEQSRACLAFQLAISDLYNSPILLLDEPFAGVHPTLRDECLEVLREVGQKKLILMAEHGAPDSSFDASVVVK